MLVETTPDLPRLLYLIACAAAPASHLQDFVPLALATGWDLQIIATPNATKFIDAPLLANLTAHPVLSDFPPASLATQLPAPAAILVLPATFNTLKKWVQGQADTFALHLLLSAMRQPLIPILAVPRASQELSQDPAFSPCLAHLKNKGVSVLYEPEKYPPNNNVPFTAILSALHQALASREQA